MNLQSVSFGGVISPQEGSCLIIFLALPVTPVLKMIASFLVAYSYIYYSYMYYLDKNVAMDTLSLTFSLLLLVRGNGLLSIQGLSQCSF